MLAWSWLISFDRSEWLWLLVTIPVIAAISVRSLSGLEKSRRVVAVVLRSLVIAAVAVALARIEYVKRNDHVAVMFAPPGVLPAANVGLCDVLDPGLKSVEAQPRLLP